ncbi:MAG: UvrD-helicase domain-containing protein, partial [Firmicutes bacterium]|nr:UvrD-helicase domain-containing protein [Bacillota bacterium]
MTNYIEQLNDKQREAALHTEGPLLILAGAGSGKTKTMTCRIAYLVKEMGIDPYNILAVTFTNKAAGEMRERVESLTGSTGNMWILTFHSACLRILRSHADVIGYSRDFAVYDPTDQKTLIKNILKEQNIDPKKFSPAYFLGIISKSKEARISPADYIRINGEDFKEKMVHDVYEAYEKTLKKNNAMDFDDLLLRAVELLEKDERVLEKYRRRFLYIMVDEYQDTNMLQYCFVRMLAEKRGNICVVGDDDQCIYQWRGADIRNILEFERDYDNVKIVKLEQNYRSTQVILDAANHVIANNTERKRKKLWSDKKEGQLIKIQLAENEIEEGDFISNTIKYMKKYEGREYKDFSVLYRANAQARSVEDALNRAGIPYNIYGGIKFYERKEIKDMIAYLRVIQNPQDDISLKRIINVPRRGIGLRT